MSPQRNRDQTPFTCQSTQPLQSSFTGRRPSQGLHKLMPVPTLAQASHQRLLRGGSKKSLILAYILLLLGGFIGLHHVYLGNIR